MLLLQVVVIAFLVAICYQDFKYRAVYWICFPVLAIVLFYLKYSFTGWFTGITDAGYGLSFLILQFGLLWLYFSIKHKRMINLTSQYLGWGDLLFLMAITTYFSPLNFIIFYVTSLMLVLVYALSSGSNHMGDRKLIPLAGLQAAFMGLLMCADLSTRTFSLYNDHWITQLMLY